MKKLFVSLLAIILLVGTMLPVHYAVAQPPSLSPTWTMNGGQTEAGFGCSVGTAGDVNGDGYDDIIVGAVHYDNGETNEGRACVYYGSSAGFSIVPDWTAESNQVEGRFGASVATAGDVNGDGYDDVIIGAYAYDKGQTNEGVAFVYHGSPTGLDAAGTRPIGTPDNADWVGEINQAVAYYGVSVGTAGDVNADGYDDVIVGACYYDNPSNCEGGAFVYYGSPSGLSPTHNWTAESNQANSWFGISVGTAGDVNNDGYDDVIIGAYGYDSPYTEQGAAFIYHGSSTGLDAAGTRPIGTLDNADWTGNSDQADAWFGVRALTAGDVNGDGYDDVIVGAYQYDNGQTDEGAAFVYHGSASGLSAIPDWMAESNQAGAGFGCSVGTAGDINSDGYDDVIIGAYLYGGGHKYDSHAYVYHGSASGLGDPGTPDNADWTAQSEYGGAAFGISVATAGDVNGDSCEDVIVGESYYNWALEQADEGRAYVYMGGPSPTTVGGLADSPWPKHQRDEGQTGRSPYVGPEIPELKWKYPIKGYTQLGLMSSPAIGTDNTIYIRSGTGELLAIASDGSLKWSYHTGGTNGISSPTVGADGTIYVGSRDGYLYAINPNGTLYWRYYIGAGVDTPPAIAADGTIYVGSWSNNFHAVNPNGTIKWVYTDPASTYMTHSPPAVDSDGTIYVGSYYSRLHAINASDGSQKWVRPTGATITSGPTIGSDGTIYVGSDDHKLYAVNPEDGSVEWFYEAGDHIGGSPALGADGTIYVGSHDEKLHAINPDGSPKWTFTTGGDIFTSPAIDAEGTIYIGSRDCTLYAIRPDRTLKWSYTTGSEICSSPAIGSDGTIYVASYNDYLYAISPAQEFEVDLNTVALWHFNEGSGITVADSSGNGHHGTIHGANWVNQGLGCSALDFGGGGYVEVPDGAGLDGMEELTIEAWIYLRSYPPADSTPFSPIVSKWGPGYKFDDSYKLFIDNNGLLYLEVSDGTGPGDDDISLAHSTDAVPLQQWTLIKGTWEKPGDIKLFLNDVESPAVPYSGAGFNTERAQDTSQPLWIGKDEWANVFDGIIDEVRISDVARTAELNRPPIINDVLFDPPREAYGVVAGSLVNINVDALDPDGDVLTYRWCCDLGDSITSSSSYLWHVPDAPGTYKIICAEVSDGKTTTYYDEQIYLTEIQEEWGYIYQILPNYDDLPPIVQAGLIEGVTPFGAIRMDAEWWTRVIAALPDFLKQAWSLAADIVTFGDLAHQASQGNILANQELREKIEEALAVKLIEFGDQEILVKAFAAGTTLNRYVTTRAHPALAAIVVGDFIVTTLVDVLWERIETGWRFDLYPEESGGIFDPLHLIILHVKGNTSQYWENTTQVIIWEEGFKFYYLSTNGDWELFHDSTVKLEVRSIHDANTPVGDDVTVCDLDGIVEFDHISSEGYTEVIVLSSNPGGPTKPDFKIRGSFIEITTTAVYSGTITIGIRYDGSQIGNENTLQLQHWNGYDWEDVTTFIDTVNDIIYGQVNDLSPFYVAEPNLPPCADPNGPYSGKEGSPVLLDGTGSYDPDGLVSTFEWALGDGNTDAGSTLSHVYGDNAVYDITLTVTDNDGLSKTGTTTTTVTNVSPVICDITAPLDPFAVGITVMSSANFTDPGFLDTHTAVWDWGDSTTSSGIVDEVDGCGNITGSHTYSEPGVYTITGNVTDDDGGFGTAEYRYVVVYDPDGGFVTGGGWIYSEAGAYIPDDTLEGKATFGFVSKYKKGATTPTGQTQFQFKVADLNFHSDSYQWLVIAGPQAKYKGEGTINGEGNYGFMLSAVDAALTPSTDTDLFRIKIWDKDNADTIVYDNQPGDDDYTDLTTAIGGGSIVIHKAK